MILANYAPGDASQIWQKVFKGTSIALRNQKTGKLMRVTGGNGRVTLLDTDDFNGGSKWTVGGDCKSNCTLRPEWDSSQNLNAFGNGPYNAGNAVGTWGWGGGSGNETWYWTQVNYGTEIGALMSTPIFA